MNDQGDLGEETTRLLGKDTSRTKRQEPSQQNVNQQKREPFAKEMGRTRILMDQGQT